MLQDKIKYINTGTVLYSCLSLLVISITYLTIRASFDFNFGSILLLLVMPFSLKRIGKRASSRYGFIALAFLILYVFLRINTIYFLASVFVLLYLFESNYGQLNAVPVVYVMVISPVAVFLTRVIGFEVRLFLTQRAAQLLALADSNYSATGNVIRYGEHEFHVDPVCLGLKMVTLGFFVSLALVAYFQQTKKVHFQFFQVLAFLLGSYLLVILTNFMRIVTITVLRSDPGTLSHELIGLVSFVLYVILPLYWVMKHVKGRVVVEDTTEATSNAPTKFKYNWGRFSIAVLLVVGLLLSQNLPQKQRKQYSAAPEFVSLNYCELKQTAEAHGVTKFTNDNLLIYLKSPTAFYSAEHTPLICWRGSGYSITKEQKLQLHGKEVYFCELKQGEDLLYSVWWYQSESDIVTSQLDWRINTVVNKQAYYLVNVISYDRKILEEEVGRLFQ